MRLMSAATDNLVERIGDLAEMGVLGIGGQTSSASDMVLLRFPTLETARLHRIQNRQFARRKEMSIF